MMAEARSGMPNVNTVSFMNENLGLFKDYYEIAKEKYGHQAQTLHYMQAFIFHMQCIQMHCTMQISL